MSYGPLIGYGLKFQWQDNTQSPPVYTTINGVQSVTFGSNKVDHIDVTDVASASGDRVFIGGLQDCGDITVTMNFLPGDATQDALVVLRDTRSLNNFKLLYPNTEGSVTLNGLIIGLDTTFPLDKEAKTTMKIKVSGPLDVE